VRKASQCGSNNIPSFLQRKAPSARSFCETCTWHGLHVLATAPVCCDRKARVACAQSFTLWQQATIEITRRDHSIIACSSHIYMGVVLHAHAAFGNFCARTTGSHMALRMHNSGAESGRELFKGSKDTASLLLVSISHSSTNLCT